MFIQIAATWAEKAGAVLMLLAATLLFAGTVVWPLAAPFVKVEFPPVRIVVLVIGHKVDDMVDRFR